MTLLNTTIRLFSKTKWFAWIWTILILIACSWPGKSMPEAPVVGFDKIVHIGLFSVWAVLWLMASRKKALIIILLGFAYGLGLEVYQQLLPFDRTFDWWDALADAAGILLGAGFKKVVLDRYLQRLY